MDMEQMVKEGQALGLTEEQVREMWAKMVAAPAVATEVTRWTTCSDCRTRASVVVSMVDEETGAWACDECGQEWADRFRFTKSEMEVFARAEDAAL